ncbi:1268_t:CDS:2 [Cetraspora pellucida]|uniref:1268_t:CDS:1 n=1 Tax=Cetraspora pellucida TaxID=1433469 RepID=A0A9N9B617_9GLOM|nr:1268_t:CDS:2 [Cetraspora pellucida]
MDEDSSDYEIEENDNWHCEKPIYTKPLSEIRVDYITNNNRWLPAAPNSPISLILRPDMNSIAISIGEHEVHLNFRDIRNARLTSYGDGEIKINLNRNYEKRYYKANHKDGRLIPLIDNPFNDIFDDAMILMFNLTKGVTNALRKDFVECLCDQLHKERLRQNKQNKHATINDDKKHVFNEKSADNNDKKQVFNEKSADNNVKKQVFNEKSADNNVTNGLPNNASNDTPIQKQSEKVDERHGKFKFLVIVRYGPQSIKIECQQNTTLDTVLLIAELLFSLISIENLQYKNIEGNIIDINCEENWKAAKWEMNKENNDKIEVYIQS